MACAQLFWDSGVTPIAIYAVHQFEALRVNPLDLDEFSQLPIAIHHYLNDKTPPIMNIADENDYDHEPISMNKSSPMIVEPTDITEFDNIKHINQKLNNIKYRN